jgi:Galactose oxidase, central domain/WD40-like Beta Propeller Repeat
MTDRDLEERLRAWYRTEVGEGETAPLTLRRDVAAIPWEIPRVARWFGRGRGIVLLAAAALLLVGGAAAVGSGLLRLPSVPPTEPVPPVAVVSTPSLAAETSGPTISPSPAPTAIAASRPGALIAYIRTTEKPNKGNNCGADPAPTCGIPRLWIVGSDGSNAHELFPDGLTPQTHLSWSPDGSRLLYMDNARWYLTDASGSEPQLVDTGCAAPCQRDWQAAFSSDGTKLVFMRNSLDASGYTDAGGIATMDLASGLVAVLSSTADAGGALPGWSPDGKQIVFWRGGNKDMGGPIAPVLAAFFVVDADGQNVRQVSPKTLDAENARWSPDGSRIVFTSPDAEHRDIYTIRPDGTDLRRLTTDGISGWATWTPDGRILFVRGSSGAGNGGSIDFWTMDADGAKAAELAPGMLAGDENAAWTQAPAWQPIGGPAIVPPPWTATTATPVGPPPPTPAATPTPALSPGFAWTGSMHSTLDGPLRETATRLADGRVLVTVGCSTAAELYDPATGTFTPTGSLAAVRGGDTATLLADGHVLIAGGYNCADAAHAGTWASAELYDPATGTFSPTGSMSVPREFHTATLLADGHVLITGGITGSSPVGVLPVVLASFRTVETSSSVLRTAELYDPATGTFSPTGSMSTIRDDHTATLLQDGRVLVVGGGGEGYASQASAELYDPATGRFSGTGSLKTGRWLHTATLLSDGRVLVVGGRSPKDSTYASAELYNPRTGSFTSTGSMKASRQQQTATLIPDGHVLIAGGLQQNGAVSWDVLSSTELYDPGTGTFSPAGSMGAARGDGTATLLVDGRVLIAGGTGIGTKGLVGLTSAVLYQP